MAPIYPDLWKLAAVSVVLCVLLYTVIVVAFGITPELMLLKVGMIITCVGLFWVYFDKWGWKQKWVRLGGWLTDIPNLNGRWVGTVDRMGENDPHEFVVEIRQTYLRTQLHTYSKNSRGSSITAQFITDPLHGRYRLISTWECHTKNRIDQSVIDEFIGTSVYSIIEKENERVLEDYYFTRRHPQTTGITQLKYMGKKLQNGV
ncbi:MAG: hypothetical protein QG577_2391 [Thermodesulfobacteriota bacterium]|nr:hypothetical protein [Thermodesulfobacteriota bacterium]